MKRTDTIFDPFENLVLDDYEKEIEDNLGKAEPLSPEDEAREIMLLKAAAANPMKVISNNASKNITIKMSLDDLKIIQFLAKEEGLKYQSLIVSIIHQYAKKRFKNVRAKL